MELKERKRINNGLPGFTNGLNNNNMFNIQFENTLLTRPNINNPQFSQNNALPATKQKQKILPSSAAGAGPWFALGEWAGSGVGSGITSIKHSDELLQDAGTSEGTVNGISYQRINDINAQGLQKDYDKEMGMSFLTNPFKGLTMLLGRHKQHNSIRAAQRQQAALNTANMANASTAYLLQQFAKEYGNDDDQLLYAKCGKDAKYASGKDTTHTADGEYSIIPNARVEDGEIIYNKEKGTAHIVPGKTSGDNNYASVLPSDTIISNKYGLSDKAKAAAVALQSTNKKKDNRGALGQKTDELIRKQAISVLDNVANEQKQYREIGLLPSSKENKFRSGKPAYKKRYTNDLYNDYLDYSTLPGLYYDDENNHENKNETKQRKMPSNWWVDGFGALTSLGNMISDALQKRKRSNIYASNPYANNALNDLASLSINPYPINKELIDQNNRNIYATNRAGGLSGAQKAYANVANGLSMLNAIAASNAKLQKDNNAYKSAYANAAISAGLNDRVARMTANQYDLDYYSKAHAAKQQMLQMDLYNILALLQLGYANQYKRYTFDRAMDNYNIA